MWLLDTNTCVYYLNPRPSPVREQFTRHRPKDILLCEIVVMELYYGAFRSQRVQANIDLLEAFTGLFSSLPFDRKAAAACGFIRANLARKGRGIGYYDAMIAAIAITNQLTLVTHNVREFSRVQGLAIEDWQSTV